MFSSKNIPSAQPLSVEAASVLQVQNPFRAFVRSAPLLALLLAGCADKGSDGTGGGDLSGDTGEDAGTDTGVDTEVPQEKCTVAGTIEGTGFFGGSNGIVIQDSNISYSQEILPYPDQTYSVGVESPEMLTVTSGYLTDADCPRGGAYREWSCYAQACDLE